MLQQVEIFQGLTTEELETLAASSTSRSFPKNTVVIHENDPADSLFVIETGKVKVYCSDKNGKEFIMNTQGVGDYFGELALLDGSRSVFPCELPDEELERRRQDWQPPAPNITTGYVARYAKLVTSGSTGAVLKE